jgi:hypothetical protein
MYLFYLVQERGHLDLTNNLEIGSLSSVLQVIIAEIRVQVAGFSKD